MWKVTTAVQEQDRLYERLALPSLHRFSRTNHLIINLSSVKPFALRISQHTFSYLTSTTSKPLSSVGTPNRIPTCYQAALAPSAVQGDTQVDQPGHIPIVLDLTAPLPRTL
jgi:hypothetical protein